MSKGLKPPAWKRPKTKIYDYNYNLGEHYYKPHLKHMESRFQNRAASPPKAKTFAERFAEDPVYGNNSPFELRSSVERPTFEGSSIPPRRVSLQEDFGRDMGERSERRRPLFESRGLTPDLDDMIQSRPPRPRLDFGERLLDAAGRRRGQGLGDESAGFASGLNTADFDEAFDEPFFQQRRKLLPPRSADAALSSEDPFKKRFESLMNTADDDDYIANAKKDTDSIVAGFRSRMRARRQRDEEAGGEDSQGIESRVDRIRSRAKARLAELEDDLPALSLRDTSRSRGLRDLDDFDSSALSSATGSSKTVRISKRTIKASVESD